LIAELREEHRGSPAAATASSEEVLSLLLQHQLFFDGRPVISSTEAPQA
jgi:hypothetical protein